MKVAGVSTANFITLSTFLPTSPILNNTSFASDNTISIRVLDSEPFRSPFSRHFNLRTRDSQARCRDDGMRASRMDMAAISSCPWIVRAGRWPSVVMLSLRLLGLRSNCHRVSHGIRWSMTQARGRWLEMQARTALHSHAGVAVAFQAEAPRPE